MPRFADLVNNVEEGQDKGAETDDGGIVPYMIQGQVKVCVVYTKGQKMKAVLCNLKMFLALANTHFLFCLYRDKDH